MHSLKQELKTERRALFDRWIFAQSKNGEKSISRSDLRDRFVTSLPELDSEFGKLLQSYLTRNKHLISMDKLNVYFNRDGASGSKFQAKIERNSKRRHEKEICDSKKKYKKERTEWFYNQWKETGQVPVNYPTFPEIRNSSEEDKFNQVHYQLPRNEALDNIGKIRKTRY